MTRRAFENAIVLMYALGGSTNGVLHLLALAREAEVPLDVTDFNSIAREVPLLGNLMPAGRYNMRVTCSPYSMHRTACTIHRTPYTVHRTLYTMNDAPYTIHRTPYTVQHAPCAMHHALH
jgi:hypothetical protein